MWPRRTVTKWAWKAGKNRLRDDSLALGSAGPEKLDLELPEAAEIEAEEAEAYMACQLLVRTDSRSSKAPSVDAISADATSAGEPLAGELLAGETMMEPVISTSHGDEPNALRQQVDELRRERDYYRRQVETLAGESVRLDSTISTLRHALTQKEQGFSILAEMYQTMGGHPNLSATFARIVGAVNATLGMDKSVMLLPGPGADEYHPVNWLGFDTGFDERLNTLNLQIPTGWVQWNTPLLVNKATPSTPLIEVIREAFSLPFFIALPILDGVNPIALLVTGRMTERKPFAAALDTGDVDTLQAIGLLVSSIAYNQRMMALQEDNQVLRHLATIDKLTGIANRRRFEEVLAQEWQRCARRESSIAVFLVDVDHFKKINDTHGHDVGDVILRQVADRLTAGLRPGDVGARYGGEEFVVVLPDTDGDGALAVAERIRGDMESIPMHHGEHHPDEEKGCEGSYSSVTVSIGVAYTTPEAQDEPSYLLKLADMALYRAKREGRNRVHVGV